MLLTPFYPLLTHYNIALDAQFLTTYITSLMKSIDIRSEAAVRLLADFLDEPGLSGRERKGAEHFAHGERWAMLLDEVHE